MYNRIFYRAENFILDGNNFDSSLFVKDNDSLYSDENEVRMLFYSDYSCDCYSAEIKNNTFGNFFELSLPFENTKIFKSIIFYRTIITKT